MSKKRKYSEDTHPYRRRSDSEYLSEFAPELSKDTKFKLSIESMVTIGAVIVSLTAFYFTNQNTMSDIIKTQNADRALMKQQLDLIREELKPTPKELNAELSAQKKVLEETRDEVKGVKKTVEESSRETSAALRDLSERLTQFVTTYGRSSTRSR